MHITKIVVVGFWLGSLFFTQNLLASDTAATSVNTVKAENLFYSAREYEKNGDLLDASDAFLKSFLEYPHPTIMYEHLRLSYLAEQYTLVQNTGLKFLASKPDISKRLIQNILDMIASSQELIQYKLSLVDDRKLNAPSNDGSKTPKKITPYKVHTNIFDIERSEKMVAKSTHVNSDLKSPNDISTVSGRGPKIYERHNSSINRTVSRLSNEKVEANTVNRYNVKLIAANGDSLLLLSKDKNGNWNLRKENELKPLQLKLLDDRDTNEKGKSHVFLIGDDIRENILSINLESTEIRHINQAPRDKTTYKILGFE